MPGRLEKLYTNNVYHIFNKSLDNNRIFNNHQLASVFKETMIYYRSSQATISLSRFRMLDEDKYKRKYTHKISFKKHFLVEFLAFCIMPNHFHFLLRQKVDSGISKYVSDVVNSFTRYYNIKNERKGPLFLAPFRARRIETDEVLVHLSRYIHLNPYVSGIVKSMRELESYGFSSYSEYLGKTASSLSEPREILAIFNNESKYNLRGCLY